MSLANFDWGPVQGGGGRGVTPNDGLYGEAPSERGLFFRLQVYERGRDFTS